MEGCWDLNRKTIGGNKMGLVDIVLMILIAGAAVYILYRSILKKKGHCGGCEAALEPKENCSKEK